jgi:citrate lyase subunit beta/citryl-CoA lyase
MEKAYRVGADAVILDLEDSVAMDKKSDARELVVRALQARSSGVTYVRVNALRTEWCIPDISAVIGAGVNGIMLPKVETTDQLLAVGAMIGDCERRTGALNCIELVPLLETARGITACEELARATTRIRRLAFGAADYTLDLNIEWTRDERELDYARARLVHASRIAELEQPVDTAVTQFRDTQRFLASARNGRRMGFSGKLCIHPDQVLLCNEAFSPTDAEVKSAVAIVRAFEAAEAAGSACALLEGQFIDYPIVTRARRVLDMASRISTQDETQR